MVARVTANTEVRESPVETRPITLPAASRAAPPESVGYAWISRRTSGSSFRRRSFPFSRDAADDSEGRDGTGVRGAPDGERQLARLERGFGGGTSSMGRPGVSDSRTARSVRESRPRRRAVASRPSGSRSLMPSSERTPSLDVKIRLSRHLMPLDPMPRRAWTATILAAARSTVAASSFDRFKRSVAMLPGCATRAGRRYRKKD